MNYRHHTFISNEAINTAGTKVIDIDMSEAISRISIRVKGTNNGSTPTAHPAAIVSLIELTDGSDTLFSLTGKQCQSLNFYEQGKMNFQIEEYEDNIEACATFHLNFGRFLWDTLYALDPKKFKNLKLNITHNKASGGSTPDAGTLDVSADVFDQKQPTPRGFLQAKQVSSDTLTASGHTYVDLPIDLPIRRMILASESSSLAPTDNITQVKLSEDGGKRYPFNDTYMREYIKTNLNDFVVKERVAGLGTGSAVTYYIVPTYESYGVGVGRSASQSTLIVGQPSGTAMAVTNDSSESFAVIVEGYCPFGAIDFPLGIQSEPSDWFNPTGMKKVEVDITSSSSASGTATTVVQQARNY